MAYHLLSALETRLNITPGRSLSAISIMKTAHMQPSNSFISPDVIEQFCIFALSKHFRIIWYSAVLQAQRIIRSRPLQVAEDTGALSGSQDTTIRRTRSPDADPPAANRAPKKPRTDNHAPEDVNPVIKLESASGVDVKPAIPDQNDDDELVAMKVLHILVSLPSAA